MPRTVVVFTVGLLILASVAFWPMFLSKDWSAIDRYTHSHAIFGTLWLVILILQPALILRGYRRAHRIAGRTSMFVALAFFLSSLLLAHFRVSRMTEAAFAKEGIFIYLPFAVALLFATACLLGFRWRRSVQVHSRFMLSTALLLLDPVLARIMFFYLPPLPSEHLYQGSTFTLIAVVMAFLVYSMPPHVPGRTWYRNYCIGTVTVLALFFVVPYTGAWLAFVNWFRLLPLT